MRGKEIDLPRNKPFEFLVVADGDLFTAFINGERVMRGNDATLSAEHFGIYTHEKDGKAVVRDLQYRNLDEPP
jgi:hypothetical protein